MILGRELVESLAKAVHESNFETYSKSKLQLESVFDIQNGLSANEAEASRNEFGANVLPEVKAKSFLHFVLDAAQDRVLILLAIAAFISLAIHWKGGGWIEGAAILAAVIIVVLVNAINDWKKDRLFQALNTRAQSNIKAKVLRDGQQQLVLVTDLVIGDLLSLDPGVSLGKFLLNHE